MKINEVITLNQDNLEEGWKDWVAGAALGASALGTNVGLDQTPQTTEPTISRNTTQKQTFKFLGNNPQNESILLKTAKASGITGTELAQFLAQTKHESWDFTKLREKPIGKNYFAKKYDVRFAPGTAKILGNKHVGDGEKYHGRGFMQLTGKYNYKIAGDALGIPLLEKPELAARPDVAAKIAVWYWKSRVKPYVSNFADTESVTKKINPAMRGLQDRHNNFINYKKMF